MYAYRYSSGYTYHHAMAQSPMWSTRPSVSPWKNRSLHNILASRKMDVSFLISRLPCLTQYKYLCVCTQDAYSVSRYYLLWWAVQDQQGLSLGGVVPIRTTPPSPFTKLLPPGFGGVLAEDHCIVALGPGPGRDHIHWGYQRMEMGCRWVGWPQSSREHATMHQWELSRLKWLCHSAHAVSMRCETCGPIVVILSTRGGGGGGYVAPPCIATGRLGGLVSPRARTIALTLFKRSSQLVGRFGLRSITPAPSYWLAW